MKRIVLVVFALVSSACWGMDSVLPSKNVTTGLGINPSAEGSSEQALPLFSGLNMPQSFFSPNATSLPYDINSVIAKKMIRALQGKDKIDDFSLAGAELNGIEDDGSLVTSIKSTLQNHSKEHEKKELISRLRHAIAMDYAVERRRNELRMRAPSVPDAVIWEKVIPELLNGGGPIDDTYAEKQTDLKANDGESFSRFVRWLTTNGLVAPFLAWAKENDKQLRRLGILSLVASSLALTARYTGLSTYIKNKIDESFRRQRPYTILRRKKGWHTRKGEVILTKNDVKLPPQTARQIDELIVSINRRGEYLKQRGKRANFDSVLLYGPPGTGKTTIARLIADQTVGDDSKPMNLITLMAADFKQVAAEGDRMVVLKEMFDRAEKMGNTIIFLDEIDSMSQERGKSNNERGFIDTLLHLLNKRSPNVMVIGATNHMNLMDEALLSRFRRKIEVGLPTARQRKSILELNVERYLIGDDFESQLDTSSIALKMRGASGRDIEAFVLRLRDRLNYDIQSVATMDYADEILREMGYLPPLAEEDALLEDVIAEPEVD